MNSISTLTVPWMTAAIAAAAPVVAVPAAVIPTWVVEEGGRGAIPRRRGKHLRPIGQTFDYLTLLSFVIWHAYG